MAQAARRRAVRLLRCTPRSLLGIHCGLDMRLARRLPELQKARSCIRPDIGRFRDSALHQGRKLVQGEQRRKIGAVDSPAPAREALNYLIPRAAASRSRLLYLHG